jgi:Domain of unknown function (DUF4192)
LARHHLTLLIARLLVWQAGDGALANVALDRALADNPRYSMALLPRYALDSGAPPSMARADDAGGEVRIFNSSTGAGGGPLRRPLPPPTNKGLSRQLHSPFSLCPNLSGFRLN